jgi:hypothetical protein
VPTASPGLNGTHQPGGSGSQDDRVVSLIHASISLSGRETVPYSRCNSRRIGKACSRLHATLERLEGVQGVIKIVFFLDVVPGLTKKLPGSQHNR